jgi:hypothetical protein
MAVSMSTKKIFFDSDCISSFLWVNEEDLLTQLFSGIIVIPTAVYRELSHPSIPHFKPKIDLMINNGHAEKMDVLVGTSAYDLYSKMTTNPDIGNKIIGFGEAAVLALAFENTGIAASNNTSDVTPYAKKMMLNQYTTGDILYCALEASLIDLSKGNAIWAAMLKRQQWLRYPTFSDFLAANSKTKK